MQRRLFCASAPTTSATISAIQNGACMKPGPASDALNSAGTVSTRIKSAAITVGSTLPSETLTS